MDAPTSTGIPTQPAPLKPWKQVAEESNIFSLPPEQRLAEYDKWSAENVAQGIRDGDFDSPDTFSQFKLFDIRTRKNLASDDIIGSSDDDIATEYDSFTKSFQDTQRAFASDKPTPQDEAIQGEVLQGKRKSAFVRGQMVFNPAVVNDPQKYREAILESDAPSDIKMFYAGLRPEMEKSATVTRRRELANNVITRDVADKVVAAIQEGTELFGMDIGTPQSPALKKNKDGVWSVVDPEYVDQSASMLDIANARYNPLGDSQYKPVAAINEYQKKYGLTDEQVQQDYMESLIENAPTSVNRWFGKATSIEDYVKQLDSTVRVKNKDVAPEVRVQDPNLFFDEQGYNAAVDKAKAPDEAKTFAKEVRTQFADAVAGDIYNNLLNNRDDFRENYANNVVDRKDMEKAITRYYKDKKDQAWYDDVGETIGQAGTAAGQGLSDLVMMPSAIKGMFGDVEAAENYRYYTLAQKGEMQAEEAVANRTGGAGFIKLNNDVIRIIPDLVVQMGIAVATGGTLSGAQASLIAARTGISRAAATTALRQAAITGEKTALKSQLLKLIPEVTANTVDDVAEEVLKASARTVSNNPFKGGIGTQRAIGSAYAGLTSASSTFGQVYTDVRNMGKSPEESIATARTAAVVAGAITSGLTHSFGMLGRGGVEDFASMGRKAGEFTIKDIVNAGLLDSLTTQEGRQLMLNIAKGISRDALSEGAEEGLDQALNLISQYATNPSPEAQNRKATDIINESLYATLLGGIAGGGAASIGQARATAPGITAQQMQQEVLGAQQPVAPNVASPVSVAPNVAPAPQSVTPAPVTQPQQPITPSAAVSPITPEEQANYDAAKAVVIAEQNASISLLQRKLRLGYGRAQRIMDLLEQDGVIAPKSGTGAQSVLVQPTAPAVQPSADPVVQEAQATVESLAEIPDTSQTAAALAALANAAAVPKPEFNLPEIEAPKPAPEPEIQPAEEPAVQPEPATPEAAPANTEETLIEPTSAPAKVEPEPTENMKTEEINNGLAPAKLPKGATKIASSPTKEGVEKQIAKFYAGEKKNLVPVGSGVFAVESQSGKRLSTRVIQTPKGFYFVEGTAEQAEVKAETPARDTTKPEQMTPEEYHSYNAEGIIADYESGGKVERGFASYETVKPMSEAEKADIRSDKEFSARNQRSSIDRAVEDKAAVSAAAVDAYSITLPSGYVKQGELYVYQPEQKAEAAVKESPTATEATVAETPVKPRPDVAAVRAKIKEAGSTYDKVKLIEGMISSGEFIPAVIEAAETGDPLDRIPTSVFVSREQNFTKTVGIDRISAPKIKVTTPEKAAEVAISKDETRFILNGVFLDAESQKVVATDGKLLIAIPAKIDGKSRVVFNRNIKESKNNKAVKKGDIIIGSYPNWKGVVPEPKSKKKPVNTDEALRATTVLIGAKKPFNRDDSLVAVVEIEKGYFNPEYIKSAITGILQSGAKSIVSQMDSDTSPLLLTGDNGAFAVVMPLRVPEKGNIVLYKLGQPKPTKQDAVQEPSPDISIAEPITASETPEPGDEVEWTTGRGDKATSVVGQIRFGNAQVEWFGIKYVPLGELTLIRKSARRINREKREAGRAAAITSPEQETPSKEFVFSKKEISALNNLKTPEEWKIKNDGRMNMSLIDTQGREWNLAMSRPENRITLTRGADSYVFVKTNTSSISGLEQKAAGQEGEVKADLTPEQNDVVVFVDQENDTQEKAVAAAEKKKRITPGKARKVGIAKQIDRLGITSNDPESVIAALEKIAAKPPQKHHGRIAKDLLSVLEGSGVQIQLVSGNDARMAKHDSRVNGWYDPKTNTAYINLDGPHELGIEETILHELVHASGEKVIQNPQTDAQKRILADLEKQMLAARKNAIALGQAKLGTDVTELGLLTEMAAAQNDYGLFDILYGVSSLSEYHAHATTSRSFQKFLATYKEGGKRSLFERFINSITSLLSGKKTAEGSDAEKAYATLLDLMREGKGDVRLSNADVVQSRARGASTEQDAEYLELAKDEEKNAEALQAMVDAAAKAAGYNIEAFHGTDAPLFTEFQTEREEGKTSDPNAFMGSHFTANKDVAEQFANGRYGAKGGRVMAVRIKMENPMQEGSGSTLVVGEGLMGKIADLREKYNSTPDGSEWARLQNNPEALAEAIEKDIDALFVDPKRDAIKKEIADAEIELSNLSYKNRPVYEEEIFSMLGENYQRVAAIIDGLKGAERIDYAKSIGTRLRKKMLSKGYDGVIYENLIETTKKPYGTNVAYIVAYPEQIKSADPVTRDDTGNVIPLSQRFQSESPDIRFSRARGVSAEQDSEYLAAVNTGDTAKAQQMVNGIIPEAQEGMTRLWRSDAMKVGTAIPSWMESTEELQGIKDASGRWFYKTKKEAERHMADFEGESLSFVDVPSESVESFNAKDNPFAGGYGKQGFEYFVPRQIAERRISTAPVVRDDNGNAIPLSQRLNPISAKTPQSRARSIVSDTVTKFAPEFNVVDDKDGPSVFFDGRNVTVNPDALENLDEYEAKDLSERAVVAAKAAPKDPISASIIQQTDGYSAYNFDSATRKEIRKSLAKAHAVATENGMAPLAMDLGAKLFEYGGATDAEVRKSMARGIASDEEYLAAVEAGDMEKAQQMVDEAAKAAGWNVGPVWHGTTADDFTVFDKLKRGSFTNAESAKMAFFFTDSEENAAYYSGFESPEAAVFALKDILKPFASRLEEWEADKGIYMQSIANVFWKALNATVDDAGFAISMRAAENSSELASAAEDVNDYPEWLEEMTTKTGQWLDSITRHENAPNWGWKIKAFLKMPEAVEIDGRGDGFAKTIGIIRNNLTQQSSGLIARNVKDPILSSVFAVFEPNQIKSADPVTRDDAGNIIPLSQRFQPTSTDIRFSRARGTGEDATFVELERRFKAGDKDAEEEARKLIEKMAKEQGWTEKAYHGTPGGGFTVFDIYGSRYGLMGQGAYFTNAKDVAQSYAENKERKVDSDSQTPQVYEVFLKPGRVLDMEAPVDKQFWLDAFGEYLTEDSLSAAKTNEDAFRAMEEAIADEGVSMSEGSEIVTDGLMSRFDSVTHIGGKRMGKGENLHNVTIVFNSEQIKSVDPFTYDDAGNLILLSERFQPESPDIRFSKARGIISDTVTKFAPEFNVVDDKDGPAVFFDGRNVTVNPDALENLDEYEVKDLSERAVVAAKAAPKDPITASIIQQVDGYSAYNFDSSTRKEIRKSLAKAHAVATENGMAPLAMDLGAKLFEYGGATDAEARKSIARGAASDEEYLAAVEAGDMEKAQAMVDEAVRNYERSNSNWFDVKDQTLGARYRGMEGYGVWMTRDGRTMPVENHTQTAKNFFGSKNSDYALQDAFGRGWAILRAIKAGDYRWDVPTLAVEGNESLTNTQRKNINDWAKVHGYEINWDLRNQRRVQQKAVIYTADKKAIPLSQRFPSAPQSTPLSKTRGVTNDISERYSPRNDEETIASEKALSNNVIARIPELAVAAVRMKNNQITADEYADLVDLIDPFTTKGPDKIPSNEKIKKYIAKDKADMVGNAIQDGKEVEFRIDIPTYNRSTAAGDTVYAVTAHEPVSETSKRVGQPISYLGIAKVINPTFMTRAISGKGSAVDIAAGAGKFPLATVKGIYESIVDLPSDISDQGVWAEVGYNPIRSSYFVDTRSKQAVIGGSEAIMVGSRVFVKDAILEQRATGFTGGLQYSRARGTEGVVYVPTKRSAPRLAVEKFFAGFRSRGMVTEDTYEIFRNSDAYKREIASFISFIGKDFSNVANKHFGEGEENWLSYRIFSRDATGEVTVSKTGFKTAKEAESFAQLNRIKDYTVATGEDLMNRALGSNGPTLSENVREKIEQLTKKGLDDIAKSIAAYKEEYLDYWNLVMLETQADMVDAKQIATLRERKQQWMKALQLRAAEQRQIVDDARKEAVRVALEEGTNRIIAQQQFAKSYLPDDLVHQIERSRAKIDELSGRLTKIEWLMDGSQLQMIIDAKTGVYVTRSYEAFETHDRVGYVNWLDEAYRALYDPKQDYDPLAKERIMPLVRHLKNNIIERRIEDLKLENEQRQVDEIMADLMTDPRQVTQVDMVPGQSIEGTEYEELVRAVAKRELLRRRSEEKKDFIRRAMRSLALNGFASNIGNARKRATALRKEANRLYDQRYPEQVAIAGIMGAPNALRYTLMTDDEAHDIANTERAISENPGSVNGSEIWTASISGEKHSSFYAAVNDDFRRNLDFITGAPSSKTGFSGATANDWKRLGDKILEHKNDVPAFLRTFLGEKNNPLLRVSDTLLKQSHLIAVGELYQNLAKTGMAQGWIVDRGTLSLDGKKYAGWKTILDSEKTNQGHENNPFSGKYIDPVMADAINVMLAANQPSNTAFKAVAKFVGFALWGVTAGSVKAIIRNLSSVNSFLLNSGFLATILDPRRWRSTAQNVALASIVMQESMSSVAKVSGGKKIEGKAFKLADKAWTGLLAIAASQRTATGLMKGVGTIGELATRMKLKPTSEAAQQFYSLAVRLGVANDNVQKEAMERLLSLEETISRQPRDKNLGRFAKALKLDGVVGFGSYLLGTIKSAGQQRSQLYGAPDDFTKILAWLNEMDSQARIHAKDTAQYNEWKGADGLFTNMPENLVKLAADHTTDTIQSHSKVWAHITQFKKLGFGVLLAPFVAARAEFYRNAINSYRIGFQEIRSKNTKERAYGITRIASAVIAHFVYGNMAGAALKMIFQAFADDEELAEDSPEKREAIRKLGPEYAKNKNATYVVYKNGTFDWLDISFSDPFSFVSSSLNAARRGIDEKAVDDHVAWSVAKELMAENFGTFVSPQIAVGASATMISGYDPVRGIKIWDSQADTTAEKVQKAIAYYAKQAGTPGDVKSVMNIIKAARGIEENGRQYKLGTEIGGVFLGASVRTIKVTDMVEQKLAQAKDNLNTRVGALYEAQLRDSNDVDMDDVVAATETYHRVGQDAIRRMQKVWKAGETLLSDTPGGRKMLNAVMESDKVKMNAVTERAIKTGKNVPSTLSPQTEQKVGDLGSKHGDDRLPVTKDTLKRLNQKP